MRSRELGGALVALWVAACGAGSRATNDNRRAEGDRADEQTTEGDTTGSGVVLDRTSGARAPGVCPARFGELGPSCNDGDTPAGCGYPEGTCSCETGTWCGGAAPPPMPLEWRCRPARSACAPEGSPCTEPSPPCRLDDCGFHGMSCVGGVWRSYMTPPPP